MNKWNISMKKRLIEKLSPVFWYSDLKNFFKLQKFSLYSGDLKWPLAIKVDKVMSGGFMPRLLERIVQQTKGRSSLIWMFKQKTLKENFSNKLFHVYFYPIPPLQAVCDTRLTGCLTEAVTKIGGRTDSWLF